MSKRQANAERKRQAILGAARNVFLTEGYVDANMNQIATDANVTKQTVYRYFPSKRDLFTATLQHLSIEPNTNITAHLENPNTTAALHGFALEFLRLHLSETHIATMRLLAAESAKAPELTEIFTSTGPDDTEQQLTRFLQERLNLTNTTHLIDAFTGMLVTPRHDVLIGRPHPTEQQIQDHAARTTTFFLTAITRPSGQTIHAEEHQREQNQPICAPTRRNA